MGLRLVRESGLRLDSRRKEYVSFLAQGIAELKDVFFVAYRMPSLQPHAT
jgi:hypothetical protein